MDRIPEFLLAVIGYGCAAMVLGGLLVGAAYWVDRWIQALRALSDPFDVEGDF